MRAVCLNGTEIRFEANHSRRPVPEEFIRVDVMTAGICETDLQLARGYMGFHGVLGHEFVGVAQSGRFEGQRVVGEINCACGSCSLCNKGLPRHCPSRTVVGILNHDGAFAESLWVPEANLHPVPDNVTTDQAVFTEPVAAACRILEQVAIKEDAVVTILGDGRLGNLCAQVLSSTNCRLTVVGKHEWKLDKLRTRGINTATKSDFQPDNSSDYVIDCTGSESGFEMALATVRPCGTVILKTTVADTQPLHLAPIVIDEVTVLGSRCGPFEPALQLLSNGTVTVDDLISARYQLEEATIAFDHAQRPDALKVLFTIAQC